ncbi:hypothetical protein AAIR29_10555 [Psychrobacter sp. FBL11]|uniref:Outer membrane protein, OmpA family n=1 Tax=Psychrobacter saeujeotis TaxID=3143436 RepID=A0ABU9XBH4_9GAMM|nr:hypothetical protein [uncultured Psychrobacter sp.]
MTIIDQLEQTVTTAVLGNNSSVAHVSLLEQFYAIFITRLAQPDVYKQLSRTDQDLPLQAVSGVTVFEQLWQKASLRQWFINELAMSHHVDTQTTEKLLINAASLTYQELNVLANGQFLPVFLQTQQLSVRPYLPVWAERVISPKDAVNENIKLDEDALNDIENTADDIVESDATDVPSIVVKPMAGVSSLTGSLSKNDSTLNNITTLDKELFLTDTSNVIHTNPSDYRDSDTSESRLKGRTRNPRNNLIVKVLLLIGALLAIGLAWVFVIKPNYLTAAPVEPVADIPVEAEPTTEPAVEDLSPVELLIVLDDSGNIYTCTATVGDTVLQNALNQALHVSFGAQTNSCMLEVKQGVAKRLSNIDVEALPRVFTLLRAVPFARLQLQNAALNLEAPDDVLLQRLVTDIRTIIPTAMITHAAPLPLTNSDEITDDNNDDISMMNSRDNQSNDIKKPLNNTYDETYPQNNNPRNNDLQNNDMSSSQSAWQSNNDTSSTTETIPYNTNPDKDMNNQTNNERSFTTSIGSMSAAEVDDLANTTIVAEKLRNERPVDKNIVQER